MKKWKLVTQVNVIFSMVTLITGLVFFVALAGVVRSTREQQNIDQLSIYFEQIKAPNPPDSDYNGYAIYQNGTIQLPLSDNFNIISDLFSSYTSLYNYYLSNWRGVPGQSIVKTLNYEGDTYYFIIERTNNFSGTVYIAFTDDAYLEANPSPFTLLIQISFISLILIGNIIILIWSRSTVDRIKHLEMEVGDLGKNDYGVPISVDGHDEITDLSFAIEKMRREIELSDNIKREMLQNVSHDFKTPISVIQSYAEAIADGISDPKEAEVIIKQVDILNQKVKQLLEFNKLEYMKDPSEFETIQIKDIINNIIDNQKFRTELKFITDLDDSTYFGVKDNFYTMFSNIVENALRYARTTIKITLQNKKLTFFNDGEPISDKFINSRFKPYEKGEKGQFGLGMSIVQKTAQHFNLNLTVNNVEDGVEFTIEPL